VEVNTLNNIKKKYNIKHVNFLKVDTEGYDPWVLEGASDLLEDTDFIIYECHRFQVRIKATFFETQHLLDSHGFDVFKIGTNQLLKFNGALYHPIYDSKLSWQNCLAVNRKYSEHDKLIKSFNPNFTSCF